MKEALNMEMKGKRKGETAGEDVLHLETSRAELMEEICSLGKASDKGNVETRRVGKGDNGVLERALKEVTNRLGSLIPHKKGGKLP